jgi:hypothetical protein
LPERKAVAGRESRTIRPKSIAGNGISYTLTRWQKLTRFVEHPVTELFPNWTENLMRPIELCRKSGLHIGSKEAESKVAAIFSIVEKCCKLNIPILALGLKGQKSR